MRATVSLIVTLIVAKSQHNAIAAVKRPFVAMSLYLKVYFIAIKRSTEISVKWKREVMQKRVVVISVIVLSLQYIEIDPPVWREISLAMNTGWATIPTAKSVPAIEASIKLCIFRSLGLVLTAIMTSVFRRIVRGQVNKFRMMERTEKSLSTNWSSNVQSQLIAFETANEWLVVAFIIRESLHSVGRCCNYRKYGHLAILLWTFVKRPGVTVNIFKIFSQGHSLWKSVSRPSYNES